MLTKKEIECLEILCADCERHWLAELEEVVGKEINMSIEDVKNFKHDELICEVNEDGDIIFFEKPEPELKKWLITYLYKGMEFNTVYEATTADKASEEFYSEWAEDEYDMVLSVDEYEEYDLLKEVLL